MEKTDNQENNATGNEERTFTQDEVNAMIGKRVFEEKSKYADYETLKEKADRLDKLEESSKSELQKAVEKSNALQAELDGLKKANQIRELRQKVADETGIPASLLTADTEDGCRNQAEAIKEYAAPKGYPNVRDSGELQTPVGKKSTRDLFSEWSENVF